MQFLRGRVTDLVFFRLELLSGTRSFDQIHFQAGCHKESGTRFLLDHNALLYWLTPRL